MARSPIVVIGAGHNGLIAAAYLAEAGFPVTVLERSSQVGGILRNTEPAPGFVAPGVIHTVGRLRRSVVSDLELPEHGYATVAPDARMFAPQPDGSAVTFWSDAARTADELGPRSSGDAKTFLDFDARVRTIASFLAYINVATPPDARSPSMADAMMGLKLGKAFKDLGAMAGRETLRSLPMAVADLVQEAFDSEAVRGPLATRGIKFTATGPWAAGSAAVFLNDSAGNDGGAAGEATFAIGGTGALAASLAAAAGVRGVTIRTDAQADRIRSRDGRVVGVTLADGSEIDTTTVVSACDPKRTLRLCDPSELGPHMVWRANNIRTPGATAKVNLALSGLPSFDGADDDARLHGRIVIGTSIDHVEKAKDAVKYGLLADDPWLEATIPSLVDPSLSPEGKHVMSVLVEGAPRHLRDSDWKAERARLGDVVVATLERSAPGIGALVEGTQVITPEDLETDYGLSGGHVYHAEPGLDQFFAWRPLAGEARYRFVLDGLFLAGSGAHPGGGITGGPGANAARTIIKALG